MPEPIRVKKLIQWVDLGEVGVHGIHPYDELIASRTRTEMKDLPPALHGPNSPGGDGE